MCARLLEIVEINGKLQWGTIHCSGSSELEIKRRTAFIRESMFALDQNIWGSGITLETKFRLYNTCIMPIFLYGSEIWCLTSTLEKKIDALDNWCLRRILHIHWTEFVSNDVVRSHTCTGQPLLSDTIRQRRLPCFGHLCRANIGQDHSRVLRACIRGPPKDWRRRTGKPRQTWLRKVEDDLRPLNFGLATARRRAMDRTAWRLLVDAAIRHRDTLQREICNGLLFRSILKMCVQNLKFVPWIIGVLKKFRRSLDTPTLLFPKIFNGLLFGCTL